MKDNERIQLMDELADRLNMQPEGEWTASELSARVFRWCLEVLAQMPETARENFLDQHFGVWWLHPGTSCCAASGSITRRTWHPIIILQSDLACVPVNEAKGIIAHEFAHLVLKHWHPRQLRYKTDDRREAEADRLACDWGFSEEIAALRMEKRVVR